MPVRAERYAFYFQALDGDTSGWDHEQAPWPGFYRARYHKNDHWQPVAIWDDGDGGQLLAVIGRDERAIGANRVWVDLHCWQHAVTEQQYRQAVTTGEWWDTLHASKTEQTPGAPVVDVAKAEPIGPPLRKGAS